MYNIGTLKEELNKTGELIKEHFKDFFENELPEYTLDCKSSNVECHKVTKYEDLKKIYSGTGMYIILSNYKLTDPNHKCLLVKDNFKAIYRGHATTVKERIESHLFNTSYSLKMSKKISNQKESKSSVSRVFTECMKLDGNNGININRPPYNSSCGVVWYIMILKMPGSNVFIREKAEEAFVEVFNLPMGCSR